MTIGEKIRALRIERGMSQNDLAHACGYTSRASINKIELGKVDLPQSKIKAIANALDVSPASLILDDGLSEDGFSAAGKLDKKLIEMLSDLSPQEEQIVMGFLAGLKANRTT